MQMDASKAYHWFSLAANQGDTDAQCAIGDLYAEGNGVPQDYSEAVEWHRMAAEKSNDAAQAQLGLMYEIGKGVPQDLRSGAYVVQPSGQPKFFGCGTVCCCHGWHRVFVSRSGIKGSRSGRGKIDAGGVG
jgi:TPR repeat protein